MWIRIKIIFICFLIFSTKASAFTQSYMKFDYGLGQFNSEKMSAYEATPTGNQYSIAFGAKFNYIELGVYYRKSQYQSKIIHDSVENEILHEGSGYGAEMSIFLNRRLSLKVGYGMQKYSQNLKTELNGSVLAAVKTIYGIETESAQSNPFYGINVDFFGNKKYDLYISIIQSPLNDGKSITTGQIGFRIYTDTTFSSFFNDRLE
jgi:hypothetical protein